MSGIICIIWSQNSTYDVMCLFIRAGIQVFGWQQYPGTCTEQISAELSGLKAIQDIS